MKPYRNLRVAALIEEELSKILLKDFEFEGALVTVMAVEVSSDLLRAKIKLGIIPKDKEPEVFLKIKKSQPFIQHKLLKKINIKPMPRIEFIINREINQKAAYPSG